MRYRIADLIVEMSPKGRTAAQAEVYRTSARGGAADITIRVGGAQALDRATAPARRPRGW